MLACMGCKPHWYAVATRACGMSDSVCACRGVASSRASACSSSRTALARWRRRSASRGAPDAHAPVTGSSRLRPRQAHVTPTPRPRYALVATLSRACFTRVSAHSSAVTRRSSARTRTQAHSGAGTRCGARKRGAAPASAGAETSAFGSALLTPHEVRLVHKQSEMRSGGHASKRTLRCNGYGD
eukprot:5982776-Pleurochrysis_carterae.AAC.1